MPTNINSQIQFLSGRMNKVDDAVCGGPASSGTGAAPRLGQLGQKIELSIEDALKVSDTAVGTLLDGEYQYVQTKAASVAAPALGLVAFWTDQANYIVTPDAPASGGCIAGVYIGAPTKGNFCFIQRGGRATLKFKGSTSHSTPAACDFIIADPGTNLADALVDGNNLTVLQAKNLLGVASTAATPGGFGQVQLWERYRH